MPQKVLFRHCDPAGIVFFPRYFEMMNDCVEAFFADALDWPFQSMLATAAVPTAQIATRFAAPSRHGDRLILRLRVDRLGRSALDYTMTAHAGDELRFETTATLVHVGDDGRSARWPDRIRHRIEHMLEASQ